MNSNVYQQFESPHSIRAWKVPFWLHLCLCYCFVNLERSVLLVPKEDPSRYPLLHHQ